MNQKKSKKVLVVGGLGVVGSALAYFLRETCEVFIVDTAEPETINNFSLLPEIDAVFICVPTPEAEDKHGYDYSYVMSVLKQLEDDEYTGIVCLRSTVAPDFFAMIPESLRKKFIYQPEFLSARTAKQDVWSQTFRVYGYDGPYCTLRDALDAMYPTEAKTVTVPLGEASLLKLFHNAWGAMNVGFANEAACLCENLGLEWWEVEGDLCFVFEELNRMFSTYSQVPGPDGKKGFSGKCFPKDLQALVKTFSNTCPFPPPLLVGLGTSNLIMRGDDE